MSRGSKKDADVKFWRGLKPTKIGSDSVVTTSKQYPENQSGKATLYGIFLYFCFKDWNDKTYFSILFSFPCIMKDGFRFPTIIAPGT